MKKILALTLALLLVLSLAACGGAQTPTEPTEAPTDPVTEPVTEPSTEAQEPQVYDAVAAFTTEQVQGDVWFYGYTDDGNTNKLASECKTTEEGDYWYCDNNTYMGINRSFEGSEEWLEIINNGETGSAGVGFVAPEDAVYTFTGKTWNKNGDASSGMLINCWNQQLEILPFTTEPTEFSVSVGLQKGDVAFFWAADEYNWVTAYLTLQVTSAPLP